MTLDLNGILLVALPSEGGVFIYLHTSCVTLMTTTAS